MSQDRRGPAIHFPPPAIFAGAFLVAWALQKRLPFDISSDGAGFAQQSVGALLLALGLGLMASGLVTFWRHHTAVIPNRPAALLVQSGPYRFTRNPMYLGLTLGYVGLSALINWAWPLLLLPVALIILTIAVIRREERYLRTTFGADYDRYCRQVRRWL